MSDKKRIIFVSILIISWVGFWRWADSTLPEETKVETAQSKTSLEVCSDLMDKKDSLETPAKDLANQAKDLQRTLLRERLNQIINKDILTNNQDKILSEYMSYDLIKILEEKSDVFGDEMIRQIELKPKVVKIFNELITNGELSPYYFNEVQDMGQSVRAKFQEAEDLMVANPECFKSTLETDKLIDEALKKIDGGKPYNGWIAKHTAEELVDSIL
jgi:hypothetical protein